jgi:ABC-2 type transport system ATP-binding protein
VAVIEVCGLSKRFGEVLAVDDLSFRVGAGQVVGFLGPNGAGKTTTLRLLLGLVSPTAGEALIDGRPYRELPHPLRVVGAALEGSDAHPGRSARDHLRVAAGLGQVGEGRVDEVLELVGLSGSAERRVRHFSLGMRQRLGLATALLCEPQVLVLDEPANGLDPEGAHWLRHLLRDLAGEGRTVLISSHLLAEVALIAESVVILDHGRLVAHSSLEELTKLSAGAVTVRSPDAERLAKLLEGDGAVVEPLGGDRIRVRGASPEEVGLLACRYGAPLSELVTETAGLEDVFLQLTADVPAEGPRA